MNIKQVKQLFENGAITSFHVLHDPLSPGWLLVFETITGNSHTLQTSLNKDKVFSSLDTLFGEIESIAGRVSSFEVKV